MDSDEPLLLQAITAISQSDPLTKLLQQVQQGRMKPTDPGLRAIVEAWLTTYRKAVATKGLGRRALSRIDPGPRVNLLIERGIIAPDHPALKALSTEFEQAIRQATP